MSGPFVRTQTRKRRMTLWRLACVIVVSIAAGAEAAETIVKNDSIASAGGGTPLPTFVPGEIITSWLTTPVTGDIVGVQVFWDSLLGSNFPSQETSIKVYAGGTFPTPGATLATIVAPVLSDGTINEFRFLDPPQDTVALKVPVTAGQTFAVGLELLNQSSGNPTASAIEIDLDGCQAGRNSVLAQGSGWVNACSAGTTGDWGIRAIINPIPEPASLALLAAAALLALRRSGRLPR